MQFEKSKSLVLKSKRLVVVAVNKVDVSIKTGYTAEINDKKVIKVFNFQSMRGSGVNKKHPLLADPLSNSGTVLFYVIF